MAIQGEKSIAIFTYLKKSTVQFAIFTNVVLQNNLGMYLFFCFRLFTIWMMFRAYIPIGDVGLRLS